ncbi:contactin-associated protein-like 4 isoform X3 [Nerophis ophidion]|uniref:contactin-associated protein-like 4 isoform X3 n=1 Tax=Nerophis ophidion TaxID=159077 RepID=UPI002ADF4629|nr:contactin-associated protein-like 4 isoform X3 [Nerophis ophidion]
MEGWMYSVLDFTFEEIKKCERPPSSPPRLHGADAGRGGGETVSSRSDSLTPRGFNMPPRNTRRSALVLLVSSLLLGPCGTADICDSPLVSSLPHWSFRSSSQLSSSHGPVYAKVNRREGAGGWSPFTSDRHQWLEVDFGKRTQIAGAATQGRYGSSDWLTAYLLMFSDTGHNWRQHRQEDTFGAVPGNSNADTVVQYKLDEPVVARFLRLVPLAWNPTGRIGLRLEIYGCHYASDVANFDGSSSVLYRLNARPSPMAISLNLKTLENSGLVFHAEGKGDHGLTLALENGQLQLFQQQGVSSSPGGHLLVTVGSLLDDQHWHQVKLERIGNSLKLSVDRSTQQVVVPAELSSWNLRWLSVGAMHSLAQKSQLYNKHFHGCMENLSYNDLNLIDIAKHHNPQVTVVGNVTFSCAEPVSVAVTFTHSQSFMHLLGRTAGSSGPLVITLQFRTWNEEGLLLTFNLPRQHKVLWLYLSQARLCLHISDTGRAILQLSTGSGLSDGQWHSVKLSCGPDHLGVTVDEDEEATADSADIPHSEGPFFFGGCPPLGGNHNCRNPFGTFQGCMRLLTLDEQHVDFLTLQQRRTGNFSHLQIDMCDIIDRCSPSLCEHGGKCTQSWSAFHCKCSDTGYRGATCHSSKYEQSCEAYKHKGTPSGHYYVDVDGSGPIKPQLVYCNMTDRAWMVIDHNNTELTALDSSSAGRRRSVQFRYASEEEQLAAVLSQSEHCEQELYYHCRKPRLPSKPDSASLSRWFGGQGPGQVQTHWDGALEHSQLCSCGLHNNCLSSNIQCNCDTGNKQWTKYSGLLTLKETLPVRSLVLGGMQPGLESAYKVGPLRCHGDKGFWNAALFDKETSYLHFPTFQGELNADISFLFKTTSSSGVFLENLGIKDFIRIELRSPFEVLFSFDVGNGPLEVSVKTSAALNDDRWHAVRAERNVKEASLHVDDLPAAAQEAPSDGQIHLQLNSQLFVGGTASRQKGFLGCMRSLQLNGVVLDLEERARITPGVQPGCPGHCSSYEFLCRNQGRCVEEDSGFSCDCRRSSYIGAFCHEEVSAYFKSTTSIILKEHGELSPNHSALPPSIFSDITSKGENVTLKFRTTQSPALLLFVDSFHREYLALLINEHGALELRYKLHSSRDAEVLASSVKNLADGRLHSAAVRRRAEYVSIQVDENPRESFLLTSDEDFDGIKGIIVGRVHDADMADTELSRLASLGFTGCLSAVEFNSISPLKAALLQPGSHVTVTGVLTQADCGSPLLADPQSSETTHSLPETPASLDPSQPLVNTVKTDSALIGGVIALVVFVTLSVLAVIARLACSRRETYPHPSMKAAQPDITDAHRSEETVYQSPANANQKEFFI